jgi:hypothetical protein
VLSKPLPQNILELLARPNPAVMATLAADDRPVRVATWYLLETTHNSARPRRRLSAAQSSASGRPRLADRTGPQRRVHPRQRARARRVYRRRRPSCDIDPLSQHYTGQPNRNRNAHASASTLKSTAGAAGAAAHQSVTDPLISARELSIGALRCGR